MTSNYAAAATAAADTGFQGRVRASIFAACARIGSGGFIDQQQRSFFTGMMHQVIAQPDLYVSAFTWTLAAYCGLDNTSSDAALDTAINGLWPAVSGYLAAGT